MRKLARRRSFLAALAAAALAVIALGASSGHLSPARLLTAWWPLDLARRPPDLLLDARLGALKADRATCRAMLSPPHAETSVIADTIDPATGCGWSNGFGVRSLSAVRIGAGAMTCDLAAAVALWLEHDVQPLAVATFGERVRGLRHQGTYACRNVRGSPDSESLRSEHATANAIDIAAFTLASGREVSVLRHWRAEGPEQRFLEAIHARACRYFRVAIGPNYNAAHRDHVHLDRGAARKCR